MDLKNSIGSLISHSNWDFGNGPRCETTGGYPTTLRITS
jgi:hypothetical protein